MCADCAEILETYRAHLDCIDLTKSVKTYYVRTYFEGLLALYLCTRNCCGLILNLFFAAISTACGIALFYTGFSRPLGITLMTIGVVMTVGIIIAYVYHKITGIETS